MEGFELAPIAPGVVPPPEVAIPESGGDSPSRPPRPWRDPAGWFASLNPLERMVFWISLIGGLGRLFFVLVLHRPQDFDYSDMHSYYAGAQSFANPNKPTDPGDWYYPSGTSMAIAFWIRLFGLKWGSALAAGWQGALSAIEIPLVFHIGKRFFDERVGFIATLLFATHYLSIGYAGFYMSENYLTIGLIAGMALYRPREALWCFFAGLLLGYGAWAKSQAVLLAPLWGLFLLAERRWKSFFALALGSSLIVFPVSLAATIKSGQAAFISTNGGQTFALGQCPIQGISYEDPVSHGRVGFGVPNLYQRLARGEIEGAWASAHYDVPFRDSKFYLREGINCMRKYPWHAFRMFWIHLFDTFAGPPWSNVTPWPDSHTDFRWFSLFSNLFVSYVMAPLAFWALWRNRRSQNIWIVFGFPMLSLLASAALFHGDPRFRAPYDFSIFIAGSVGLVALIQRMRERRALLA